LLTSAYLGTPICTNTNGQEYPVVDGNIVVWIDSRNWNSDIYGYNLETETEFPILTTVAGSKSYLAIGNNIVVWRDSRNPPEDIYGYNLDTETEFPICTAASNQGDPDTDGNIIVWEDARPGGNHIYGFGVSGNDECLFAAEVSRGVPFNGTTVGATGTVDISSCAYNDTKDVWHSFTPSTGGDYTISLCGSDFDTTLTIFDECDGAEIACNDDYCGVQSQVSIKAKADVPYIIRIAGYDRETGDYSLAISGPGECVNRPRSDLNNDCIVDYRDFAIMALEWSDCGLEPPSACWE
jgi:beta propeller repeat protein